jgi:hypothetical protein
MTPLCWMLTRGAQDSWPCHFLLFENAHCTHRKSSMSTAYFSSHDSVAFVNSFSVAVIFFLHQRLEIALVQVHPAIPAGGVLLMGRLVRAMQAKRRLLPSKSPPSVQSTSSPPSL